MLRQFAGNFYIFRHFNDSNPDSYDYCDPSLLTRAFLITIATYVYPVIHCMVDGAVAGFISCYKKCASLIVAWWRKMAWLCWMVFFLSSFIRFMSSHGYRRFMVIEACLGVIEYLIFEHNNISKSYLGVNKYLNISNEVNFSNVYVYLHLLSLSIGMVRFSMLINTLLIVTDSF